MALVLNGSGSITGLSAGGLPDGSVTADDIASLPAGSVLQVVQGTTSTGVTSTSTSYADTGLTATITPTSATSKILVVITQPFYLDRSIYAVDLLGFKVLRDSTTIYDPYSTFSGGPSFDGATSGRFAWVQSASKLDSPATISSITYKTQFRLRVTSSSAAIRANADGSATNCESTIILMEIAA
jgi:hypothetical protein